MTNEELVTRIKTGIDTASNMLQLYNQTKRFIHVIAKRYQSSAELEDLEQEGYLALYDAIDGYNLDQGCKFLTYAEYWIKQRMIRFIHNNGTVRIPISEQSRIQEYNKMVNAFHMYLGRKPTRREIGANMGLSYQQVVLLEKSAEMRRIGSLDGYLSEDEDSTMGDMVPDTIDVEASVFEEIEQQEKKKVIWCLVDKLEAKRPEIIRKRYQENMTRRSVAELLEMTENDIRREEEKAMIALRRSKALRIYRDDYIKTHTYRHGTEWGSSTEMTAIGLTNF